MLQAGLYQVPPGHVAQVVTYLDMHEKPALRPEHGKGLQLRRVAAPDVAWYRALFRRVGAEDWLWYSRLMLEETELAAILGDPEVEVYALDKDGREEGFLELDFREDGACELAFFGVSPGADRHRCRALDDEPGAGAGLVPADQAVSCPYLHAGSSRRFGVLSAFGVRAGSAGGRNRSRSAA